MRALLLVPLLVTACATSSAERIRVQHSLEGRQCEAGGRTLADLEKRLAAAGVKASAARCASDGRMRVQMCGAADGRLGVFEIAAADRERAAAAGFRVVNPDAKPVEQACR